MQHEVNANAPSSLPEGRPLVAWIGDDFTGAAATMEVLAFAGLKSVLFLAEPTASQLAQFKDVSGLGIATMARTRAPEWMDEHLPRMFRALADSGAELVHYKVCSTLDSSVSTGSIGRALNIGVEAFAHHHSGLGPLRTHGANDPRGDGSFAGEGSESEMKFVTLPINIFTFAFEREVFTVEFREPGNSNIADVQAQPGARQ